MVADPSHTLPTLIKALLRPEAYSHPVQELQLVETHISWVVLTGRWAYKIKKPVNLGFVQASQLEQRLHYCREELRLNRRLAPELYRAVLPVIGPEATARILPCDLESYQQQGGDLIEATVQMKQFPAASLLSSYLQQNPLPESCFETLAEELATFHLQAGRASSEGRLGSVEAVVEPVRTNLRVLEEQGGQAPLSRSLHLHRSWTSREANRLQHRFQERLLDGAIRECHGDLHCGNIHRRQDGSLEVFDAIDFNPSLRWIDPISEMAFLSMDLQALGHPDAAAIVLNRWLECTGEYGAMDLWRWYFAYRAMVRAKVNALRHRQASDPKTWQSMEAYIARASAMEAPPRGGLVLMHGLSGSGKSTVSRILLAALPAVRLRSDLERARAFGRLPLQPGWRTETDPYSPEVNDWLFGTHLPLLTQRMLSSGFHVIVDATFLRKRERQRMLSLAKQHGHPALIVACDCSDATAIERIRQRQAEGRDPSEADLTVRERQKHWLEPLDERERQRTVQIGEHDELHDLAARLKQRLEDPTA